MRFIKYFKLFLENFTDNSNIRNYVITYFHTKLHDINIKILQRTSIKNENEFNEILNNIIIKIENDKLIGNYTFVSFKYSAKIVTKTSNKILKIITILGKDEKIKNNDKIIVI